MNSGIYEIVHRKSGKRYIGSAKNCEARWATHRSHLRKGKHHSAYLQRAWTKYGESAFEFRVVFICGIPNLLMYEQLCIDGYGVLNRRHGYNTNPTAGSMLGFKHSPETIAKFRLRVRKPITEETRAKLSAAHKGRKMPDWFPAFISKARTGLVFSRETRDKMRDAKLGRHQPLAMRENRASKLTLEKAREIRRLSAAGVTQKLIAAQFGVDPSTVSDIVHGHRWPDRT